jgi:membrane fusion protein, copper/silver efflux system
MITKTKHVLLSLMTVLGLACSASNANNQADAPQPAKEGVAKKGASPTEDALLAYERARALLADDKLEGVAEAAAEMEAAAKAAAPKAPEAQKPQLEALAAAAAGLKATKSIDEARKSFGEVSRTVVTLVAADPALAKGRYAFECPMAPAYKKWVQTSAEISNPYMGKKMLACGMESSWN